jgi:hypothetical protein
VSFAAITLCVASQQVFSVVSIHFVTDSILQLLDTPLYIGRYNEISISAPTFMNIVCQVKQR